MASDNVNAQRLVEQNGYRNSFLGIPYPHESNGYAESCATSALHTAVDVSRIFEGVVWRYAAVPVGVFQDTQ